MLLLCSPLYSQTGISQGNWDMRKGSCSGPREGAGVMSVPGGPRAWGLAVFAPAPFQPVQLIKHIGLRKEKRTWQGAS